MGKWDESKSIIREIFEWICAIFIIIAILFGIAFIVSTMIHWLLDINYDACYEAGRNTYSCYVNPMRYSLPEVLDMEWKWIIAHKVI